MLIASGLSVRFPRRWRRQLATRVQRFRGEPDPLADEAAGGERDAGRDRKTEQRERKPPGGGTERDHGDSP